MKSDEIEVVLNQLSAADRKNLLVCYGHQLTIACRDAYEFQGPGVLRPRLLRDANEIHHRVYQAVQELERGDGGYTASEISHWIAAIERNDEIQRVSTRAFEWAVARCAKPDEQ